ncbi:hypothetical protein B566_EDAN006181 [Ephemera danica]|nr:hypothetical protein B566_EDAN006181 [Ephemera danica]
MQSTSGLDIAVRLSVAETERRQMSRKEWKDKAVENGDHAENAASFGTSRCDLELPGDLAGHHKGQTPLFLVETNEKHQVGEARWPLDHTERAAVQGRHGGGSEHETKFRWRHRSSCPQVSLIPGSSPRLSWSSFFSFLKGHESRGPIFQVASRSNGRWRLLDQDGGSMQGGRMLVLDGDPETYIVRAMCYPDTTPGAATSGKSGKRPNLVLKSITVESRRKAGQEGRGSLGAEQLIDVKKRVANLLGLTEFKPAQFGLFC